MKKKLIITLLTTLLVLLSTTGCSTQGNLPQDPTKSQIVDTPQAPANKQVPDTPQNQDTGVADMGFDFKLADSYVLSRSDWYDDNNILLAFDNMGQEQYLKLFSFNIEQKTSTLLYDGFLAVNYSDSILLTDQKIGYQNYERALIFDQNSMTLSEEIPKPDKDLGGVLYSPDMKFLAEIREDGLYVTDNASQSEKLVDSTSKTYGSLSWADDDSKLLYISNQGSAVNIIDLDSNEKRTLVGGKDFENPDGIVELQHSRFLPNNSDFLVTVLCESNDAFVIFDSANGYQSKIISENGRITIMDATGELILYVLDVNDTEEWQLITYNYVTDSKTVIFSSNDTITSAGFSPTGKAIAFSTYSNRGQTLYSYQMD